MKILRKIKWMVISPFKKKFRKRANYVFDKDLCRAHLNKVYTEVNKFDEKRTRRLLQKQTHKWIDASHNKPVKVTTKNRRMGLISGNRWVFPEWCRRVE